MNRQRLLLLPIIAFIALIAWRIYSQWGLITVDADDQLLSKVIHSIESQGGVKIASNIPGDTKVTMHVHKVPLGEAMETLATVTESRWRLTYIFAPSQGEIMGVLSAVNANQKSEGWKAVYYPTPPLSDASPYDPVLDPRKDTWTVKAPSDKTLQGYLDQGARSVSASFVYPETLNPPVGGNLSSGRVGAVAAKLANISHLKEQEVILLTKRMARPGEQGDFAGGGEDGMEGGRFGRFGGSGSGGLFARGGQGGPEAMEDRARAEIDKLPASEREAALRELEERKAFFLSLKDLTPAQRQQKMEEMMNQQSVQNQIDAKQNARDSRLSPDQRMAKSNNYLNRAQSIRTGLSNK